MGETKWVMRGVGAGLALASAVFVSERLAQAAGDLLGPLMSTETAENFERALWVFFTLPGALTLFAVALYGAAARLRGPGGPDELAEQSALVTAAGTALFLAARGLWLMVFAGPGFALLPSFLGIVVLTVGLGTWFLGAEVAVRAWLEAPELGRALSPGVLFAGARAWTRVELGVGAAVGALAALGVATVPAAALPMAVGLELASLAWAARSPGDPVSCSAVETQSRFPRR